MFGLREYGDDMTAASVDLNTLYALEESLFRTWPALETERYGGWVLRFAAGYTGRSNAATALYDTALEDADAKLDYVEAWYRQRGQPPRFRLPSAPHADALGGALERRGHPVTGRSRVMLADVRNARAHDGARDTHVTLDAAFSEAWADMFCAFNAGVGAHRAVMSRLLLGIALPKRFATVWAGDEAVAVGLVVRDGARAALYDIAVREDMRGRGYGGALIGALLTHAHADGATEVFLQVDASNTPALRLYAGMGFQDVYGYVYR